MATLTFVEKTCFVCGSVNNYSELTTLSTAAPVGIDGHPGDVKLLIASINYCPSCGYATEDVSLGDPTIATIVLDDEYQAIFNNEKIDSQVKKFLCAAFIKRLTNDYASSAKMMLNAVWVAEYLQQKESFISQLRQSTLEIMSEAQEKNDPFELTIWHEAQLIVELYRREAAYEDALELCRFALQDEKLSKSVEELLKYEHALCKVQDSSPKTIRDMKDFFRSHGL